MSKFVTMLQVKCKVCKAVFETMNPKKECCDQFVQITGRFKLYIQPKQTKLTNFK